MIKNNKTAWLFLAGLGAAWIPALLGFDVLESAAGLLPVALSGNPYILVEHAWFLYIWCPVVILSAIILFLSPGLVIALGLPVSSSAPRWVLHGFAISLVVVSLTVALIQMIFGVSLQGLTFGLLVAAITLLCFGCLVVYTSKKGVLINPLRASGEKTTLLSMILIPWILLVLLAPKFYWENFNGDGAHAFEASRLLLHSIFPFWEKSAGDVSSFPGISSMLFLYPVSWFVRFFGEYEAAARVPFIMFLAALFSALLASIESGINRRLDKLTPWLLWFALVVYSYVVAYSATYSPFSADIALPATQDTMYVALFLGFTLSFLEKSRFWGAVFLILSILCLPIGLIMLGFWFIAIILIFRPIPKKELLFYSAITLFALLVTSAASKFLELAGHPTPGGEYGLVAFLIHFVYLQWSELERVAFIIFPSGILPALSLIAWRWQDKTGNLFTVVTGLIFLFYYFQAHTVLHYFIPAMLFPLIIFWRIEWSRFVVNRSLFHSVVAIFIVIAFIISLPETFSIDTSARQLGAAIENRTGDYTDLAPVVFKASTILTSAFPYDWDPSVPADSYGGSPLVWNYYSFQRTHTLSKPNYVILADNQAAPDGMQKLVEDQGFVLYVRDFDLLRKDKSLRPPTPAGSRIYNIPRESLFRGLPSSGRTQEINVVEALTKFGLDTDRIMDWLGVSDR